MSRKPLLFACLTTVTLLGGPMALATRAEDKPALDIRGFGGWAAGYTSNNNQYPDLPFPIASKDVEIDNSYFTLNLLARPLENCVILAQPTWQSSLRGKEVRLDLAYIELTLVKDLRLRAGRIKNPLGLYTDIYKVGTLRPFYLLPNSYYRLAPESYAGLGLNRVQRMGSWELELDLLAGQMDFEPSDADAIIGFDPATGQYQFGSISVAARGKDVVGAGALLRLPVKGLEVGTSVYTMKLYGSVAGGPMTRLSDERQKAYAGAIEYLTDKVSLRAEGILARGYEDDDCAYVEAAYYLTHHWQVAATYDYGHFKKPPAVVPAAEPLKKNRAIGVGLNYWISPKLVWKLDYYRVSDNRAARPPDAILAALAGTLQGKTDVLIGGIHFAF